MNEALRADVANGPAMSDDERRAVRAVLTLHETQTQRLVGSAVRGQWSSAVPERVSISGHPVSVPSWHCWMAFARVVSIACSADILVRTAARWPDARSRTVDTAGCNSYKTDKRAQTATNPRPPKI